MTSFKKKMVFVVVCGGLGVLPWWWKVNQDAFAPSGFPSVF